ncbi:MAG: tetratricopeptide repeat protein, partial [Bacteroidales bacterium]|nr:tetratricopeptide repeat protein [Bacteroidales bacterium]
GKTNILSTLQSTNKLTQFWNELKRRKVVRVIIVYAAAAYVILEFVSIIAEPFGLPDWTLKFVVVLLSIGFIIAIIISWVYDITPEGVRKTKRVKEVRKAEKAVASNAWEIATYVSVVIIAALIIMNLVKSPEQAGRRENTEKSIAVLPFKNLSGNSEQVYFVEGMHEELITDLSKIKTLKVISRTSVMRYQDTKKSMPEIARELDVGTLIEGSVLRIGDQVRITAQLIDGSTDEHLWAEHYDHQLQDALNLISKVARDIASEINIVLTPKETERLTVVHVVDPVAQENYMQGRYYSDKMDVENTWKASEYFQKAIDADTNFAKAYVGLADCYGMLNWYGEIPCNEASLMTNRLLGKAFQLDDQLAEAHQALATNKFYWEWDFQGAEREFIRALDLNPSLVGNNEYPWYLMAMRRFDEAITEAKRALRLDPFTFLSNYTLAFVYSVAGRDNESIEQCQRILELGLNDKAAYNGLATAYRRMGSYDEAVKAYQEYLALTGSSPELIESLEQAFKESGTKGYWLWQLEQLKGKYNEQPLRTAKYYTQLGKKEKALTYLEIAYQKGDKNIYLLYADPDWAPLRDEPRFQA